jgi:hypothetical protein
MAVSTGVVSDEYDSEVEEITDCDSPISLVSDGEKVEPKDIDWTVPTSTDIDGQGQSGTMDMIISEAASDQRIDPEALIESVGINPYPNAAFRGVVAHIFANPIPFKAAELVASTIGHRGELSVFGAAILTMFTAEVNREMFLDLILKGQHQNELKGWVTSDVVMKYEQCSGYVPSCRKYGCKSRGRLQFVLLVRQLARTVISAGISGMDTMEGVQQCCAASELNYEELRAAVVEVVTESARRMFFKILDGWGHSNSESCVQVAKSGLYRFLQG